MAWDIKPHQALVLSICWYVGISKSELFVTSLFLDLRLPSSNFLKLITIMHWDFWIWFIEINSSYNF